MIIKQTFRVGEEEQCGEEFFAMIPDDKDLQHSLEAALECVLRNVIYNEYFTLIFDTEKREVSVLEAL